MRHYYILFTVALFLTVSCKDFLDVQPTKDANANTAIATVEDAQVSINGIMNTMASSSYYGRNFTLYGDIKGGDMTIYSTGRGLDGLYSYVQSPSSGSYSGYWEIGFNCLMQINNLIENIDRLEESGVTGFSYYKGEALSLRALVFFDMVRLYGLPYNYKKTAYGIPNVTTILDASAQLTRATVAENYSQIISDLTDGATLMSSNKAPVNGYMSYYGNIALQARVKLYMEDYDGAFTAAKEVIDSKKYTLYKPSDWVASWSKQFGSESIFEIGIDEVADLKTNSLSFYLMRYQQQKNAQGWFLASNYFLTRLGEDPTDVRWGIMDNDEYWMENNVEHKGACYKYSGSTSLYGDGKSTFTAVNVKVIRLSEVYLIASEAALHKSTPDKELAANYLNEIRKRAAALAPATAATITDDMILNERSKEFYGEGQRFFDMLRMNKTIEYNDDMLSVPVTGRAKSIDRTYSKIVLPIPQDEINANPALASQQNEGYN